MRSSTLPVNPWEIDDGRAVCRRSALMPPEVNCVFVYLCAWFFFLLLAAGMTRGNMLTRLHYQRFVYPTVARSWGWQAGNKNPLEKEGRGMYYFLFGENWSGYMLVKLCTMKEQFSTSCNKNAGERGDTGSEVWSEHRFGDSCWFGSFRFYAHVNISEVGKKKKHARGQLRLHWTSEVQNKALCATDIFLVLSFYDRFDLVCYFLNECVPLLVIY